MGDPRMRAAHTQCLLGTVRKLLGAAERRAVLDATGEATIAQIDTAIPLLWLPMTVHMALSDAVREAVGGDRNVRVWRSTMDASYDRPLLSSFVVAAANLFGMTPASLFRQGGRIYGQLTRDLGDLRFEAAGPSAGMVHLRGFPARDFRFVCYVEGLAGCLESTIAVARAIGEVRPVNVDEERGEVAYRVKWERRTARPM